MAQLRVKATIRTQATWPFPKPRMATTLVLAAKAPKERLHFGTLCLSSQIQSCLTLIRMGELEPWIDENFVRNLWFQMGEQVSVKMIRDKFSG